MRVGNYNLTEKEAKEKLRNWAEVTSFSIQLKMGLLRKQFPEKSESELKEMLIRELIRLKEKQHG